MSSKAEIPAPCEADGFMSIADAARLLFVSRRHLVKLLDDGELEVHRGAGNNRFVTKSSVLAYQEHQRAAVIATKFQQLTTNELNLIERRGIRRSNRACSAIRNTLGKRNWTERTIAYRRAPIKDVRQAIRRLQSNLADEEIPYKRDIDTQNRIYGPGEWYLRA
jgi:excisionase family DNA binding protein